MHVHGSTVCSEICCGQMLRKKNVKTATTRMNYDQCSQYEILIHAHVNAYITHMYTSTYCRGISLVGGERLDCWLQGRISN